MPSGLSSSRPKRVSTGPGDSALLPPTARDDGVSHAAGWPRHVSQQLLTEDNISLSRHGSFDGRKNEVPQRGFESIMTDIRVPFLQIYRINALRGLGGAAFCLLAISSAPPALPLVNVVFEVVGTLAIFIAIAGRGWSLFYIGGRKNSELVTAGPYSITRNPLYFFSLLGIAGLGAQTGSLLSMAMLVLAAYLAFDMAMRGEEAFLAGRYGGVFDDYRSRVPRLWPDFSLWRECEDVPLRSAGAVGSLRDGIVFLGAWITIDLIRLGQDAGLLPVVWTMPI
jgi:protein-S-isoprenylcysteine O-methyltransferase Ste14